MQDEDEAYKHRYSSVSQSLTTRPLVESLDTGPSAGFPEMERTSSRPVGHYHSYPTRTLTTSGLDVGDLPPITEQLSGTHSQRPSNQLEEVSLDGFRFSGNSMFPNI